MDGQSSTTQSPQSEQSLYESAAKIHAREVDGLFDRLRHYSTVILLGVYYLTPWLMWDDRQAILFDLPARRFYIFGLTFWPQDFFYMAWLLIIAGVALFFFTALAGRLWCGYACPQTVWTNAYVWMERITEGNRSRRVKLDKAPWNREKVLRKGAKQFLWITFSLWTGFTFVGYFTPILELAREVVTLTTGPWETFWVLFYSFATYGNAGIMREQVCKYMCPYARFQSAMFDDDTLVVSYDTARGEPRGSRRRSEAREERGLGDCIDCTLCVQVCPTGIDIREGLQYECIACAACVDACDGVMDKMGYARGLVRYTTENALEGGKSRVLRPRTVIYGTLLLILIVGLAGALLNRAELRLDVLRDRNALYRELASGQVENVYSLKLTNKTKTDFDVVLTVTGLPGLSVDNETSRFAAPAGELTTIAARVQVEPSQSRGGGHAITFTATAADNPEISVESTSRFFLPLPR
ncbi:MAG: cytochrome c oxidase accessory protein CcoG [Gammaproteobacteria bacterium]|nr:cytochrome c oxidase accessory protein CcoG [Gammaproteobacteria bacterium]NND54209.1 cytochrome c oxidase accessory protein CcoG [Gammaproteobacteria bacterium]